MSRQKSKRPTPLAFKAPSQLGANSRALKQTHWPAVGGQSAASIPGDGTRR